MTSDVATEVFGTGVALVIVIPKPPFRVPVVSFDPKRHPDSAVTRGLRCAWRDIRAQQKAASQLDDDRLLIDDDIPDELANKLCSFTR
jgi:hypothetical protein